MAAGTPQTNSAVNRADGRIAIDYPGCRVVIDEVTGFLLSWEAFATPLLSGPFTVTPYRLEDGYRLEGPFGVGYTTASVGLRKTGPVAQQARCVSLSSNAALTEANFVIEPAEGPALALTYRLHAHGSLEIVVDERPWKERSPWLDHAVEYALPLAGAEQRLPYLENRWAFYGFREYTASVKSVACAHIGEKAGVLELGSELVNGRQFVRRLVPVAAERQGKIADLADLADEGLTVDVLPAHAPQIDRPVRIVDESKAEAVLTELTGALNGVGVELATDRAAEVPTIRLELVPDTDEGISGDGYALAADDTRLHAAGRNATRTLRGRPSRGDSPAATRTRGRVSLDGTESRREPAWRWLWRRQLRSGFPLCRRRGMVPRLRRVARLGHERVRLHGHVVQLENAGELPIHARVANRRRRRVRRIVRNQIRRTGLSPRTRPEAGQVPPGPRRPGLALGAYRLRAYVVRQAVSRGHGARQRQDSLLHASRIPALHGRLLPGAVGNLSPRRPVPGP